MGNNLKSTPPMNVTPIDFLPKQLQAVREVAKLQLSGLMGKMFDNADDALFELADKAGSNLDQTMYFDSMREVRIQRKRMETAFVQGIHDGFRHLNQPENRAVEDNLSDEIEADSLSLVQDDDLEESVAVRGMISKVMSQHEALLVQITLGIDSLVSTRLISLTNNPLGPQTICLAFQKACTDLDLNIRAKLVVYKLFDKFLLGHIGEVYEAANITLKDMGVNTAFKKRSSKAKDQNRSNSEPPPDRNNRTSTPRNETQEQTEVFNFLRDLLSESREVAPSAGGAISVADHGPSLSNMDLIQLLSSLQQQRTQSENQDNVISQPLDVRHALGNLISREKKLPSQSIGRVDDDVINLVSMLFEFILDDRHLPTPMKALLARLQIPMLKVAILDNSFFSRGGHPARRLLNELSTAAMGWNEAVNVARDPLYKKVEWLVEKVLNDFDSNLDLFPDLLEDFTRFVSAERRRSELIEQRTRDAEEGLGKSQRSKAIVGKTLNEIAKGQRLSPVAIELLRDGWSSYMFLIHVKRGSESPEWQQAIQVVKDLVWSVQIPKNEDQRGVLLKMIPSLLQRLRKGLTEISFNKTKMRNLLKELEVIHLQCLKKDQSETKKPDPARETEPPPQPEEQNAGSNRASGAAGDTPAPVVARPDVEPKDEGERRAASSAAGEPLVIIESVDMDVEDIESQADMSTEQARAIGNMSVGTWVEIVARDGSKNRAKLAAIIRATGKYIFVNRVGMKVAEKTQSQLIADIEGDSITILDSAMLFDRALESVIGHLREMKN